MKTLIVIMLCVLGSQISWSQNDSIVTIQDSTLRKITTNSGEIIGYILEEDARELKIQTTEGKTIYVPQYVIESIEIVTATDFNYRGEYIGEDRFATRYFITTNGLPMKKGEHYVQWNLFGPDFQFAVTDKFGLGVMTSWMGLPIIGTAKYSFQLGDNAQFAVGALAGSGTWLAPNYGGALPFGTISFGNRKANIAFSSGYGAIWTGDGAPQGRALLSIAGMTKISPKLSLVFDSFIITRAKSRFETYTWDAYNYETGSYETQTETYEYRRPGYALIISGIRWHQAEGKALQFGFTGLIQGNNGLLPVPIPMVQWYRTLN